MYIPLYPSERSTLFLKSRAGVARSFKKKKKRKKKKKVYLIFTTRRDIPSKLQTHLPWRLSYTLIAMETQLYVDYKHK